MRIRPLAIPALHSFSEGGCHLPSARARGSDRTALSTARTLQSLPRIHSCAGTSGSTFQRIERFNAQPCLARQCDTNLTSGQYFKEHSVAAPEIILYSYSVSIFLFNHLIQYKIQCSNIITELLSSCDSLQYRSACCFQCQGRGS
jgi:hypothetical protein